MKEGNDITSIILEAKRICYRIVSLGNSWQILTLFFICEERWSLFSWTDFFNLCLNYQTFCGGGSRGEGKVSQVPLNPWTYLPSFLHLTNRKQMKVSLSEGKKSAYLSIQFSFLRQRSASFVCNLLPDATHISVMLSPDHLLSFYSSPNTYAQTGLPPPCPLPAPIGRLHKWKSS